MPLYLQIYIGIGWVWGVFALYIQYTYFRPFSNLLVYFITFLSNFLAWPAAIIIGIVNYIRYIRNKND